MSDAATHSDGPLTQPTAQSGGSGGGLSWKRLALIGGLVLLLFGALGYAGYRFMQNDALATLVDFSGQTERDTAQSLEQWSAAETGDDFDEGDGARTSEAASAHFRLINGARLALKPSSQIRFHRDRKKGTLGLDIELGEADVQSQGGAVTLGSEFGDIVLDANSSITMRRNGDHMQVDVELGSIELGKDKRSVAPGQSVELDLGGLVLDVPEDKPKEAEKPAEEPKEEPEPALDIGQGVPKADLVVKAGDTFVVHDPKPPTAIGFRVSEVCAGGPARLTVGKQHTEAKGQANLLFIKGRHHYEVRCLDKPDVVVASGDVSILRDAGTRQLPLFAPTANVATDGRRYTVLYQHRLPVVTVSWPNAPPAASYTLTLGGRTITTKSPSYTFKSLQRGRHQVVFAAATTPPRQSRTTTIEVVYDTQAPAARVSESSMGFKPGESVEVSGQALPGWSVSVEGKKVDVDSQQKFSTKLEGEGAIPITFSHPTHGTHYYLRRPEAPAP